MPKEAQGLGNRVSPSGVNRGEHLRTNLRTNGRWAAVTPGIHARAPPLGHRAGKRPGSQPGVGGNPRARVGGLSARAKEQGTERRKRVQQRASSDPAPSGHAPPRGPAGARTPGRGCLRRAGEHLGSSQEARSVSHRSAAGEEGRPGRTPGASRRGPAWPGAVSGMSTPPVPFLELEPALR